MKAPPLVHSSFSIERTYPASAARVFAAWTDIETKARWFMGPPGEWQLLERELDLRVGGRELLHGRFHGGPRTRFVARYHHIVPLECLVYAYDVYHDDRLLSVSLASVELAAASGGGTRMLFHEQAVFLDGKDGCASRQAGTAAHFERLSAVLSDPAEIVSARSFAASPARLFQAVIDPAQLTRWWGPKGFTSRGRAAPGASPFTAPTARNTRTATTSWSSCPTSASCCSTCRSSTTSG